MDTGDIVTDPSLRTVLEAAGLARQQCLRMLDLLEQYSVPANTSVSREAGLDFSREQKLLWGHLAEVRGLNRTALIGVRQTKQATAEARQEVDTLHLKLQNLYYEQRHLRGEIVACESYEHEYQQLPLISVEEFLREHPEYAEAEESDLMVARINHEHAQRQALEEQRQGLLKKKQGLIADNNKRKEDLANLDKDLEKFIEAAKPIQKTFEKEY